jgi:hypothetical protein
VLAFNFFNKDLFSFTFCGGGDLAGKFFKCQGFSF